MVARLIQFRFDESGVVILQTGNNDALKDFVLEKLHGLNGVAARPMFGGQDYITANVLQDHFQGKTIL